MLEDPVLTQGQQRAVDALYQHRLIVPSEKGAPYIIKNQRPFRIQTKTFQALLELELLDKCEVNDGKEYYQLNEDGLSFVSDVREFGTPRRYRR